jgi:hypothetical protein
LAASNWVTSLKVGVKSTFNWSRWTHSRGENHPGQTHCLLKSIKLHLALMATPASL